MKPLLVAPAFAHYSATVSDFLATSSEEVVGHLAKASTSEIEATQRDAWFAEDKILRTFLTGVEGCVFLEYVVPRIGSRIDAVVISRGVILVIEFKVGSEKFTQADYNQVWDYGLDLKNFHAASTTARIIPILVATRAATAESTIPHQAPDGLSPPACTNADGLRDLGIVAISEAKTPSIDAIAWAKAPYRPTPNIIAAAQALYTQHSVAAISRNDAGAKNLALTSEFVESIIESSRSRGEHSIIFVTGVPGAGKTLVGLNVATQRRDEKTATHAVFLSGNGPLVAVLREALTRDEVQRLQVRKIKKRKGEVAQPIKAFIQNVHHFRDAGLRDLEKPSDHVVIFDEAQRAWDLPMTSNFMQRKKGQPNFNQSEPEFLISYMDRHKDWSVVICLVGGGQEINRGEAGIGEWLRAVEEKFPGWRVYVSPNLTDAEFNAKRELLAMEPRNTITYDARLHLSVSMRSFRAEHVSYFVRALLECEKDEALSRFTDMGGKYPIVITRNLDSAKRWIRSNTRGSERVGLVASSAAHRLKPHAIDIRVQIDPVHWFLNEAEDPRSSMFLEDAATEFQVQGLELDWACVTWDADLRFNGSSWNYFSFRGAMWQQVKQADRRRYLKNAYRVLLTRARQGMAIFVPPGNTADATRPPNYYDATFAYLVSLGIKTID